MSDVKQDHPEFFKAASERDAVNETIDEASSPLAESTVRNVSRNTDVRHENAQEETVDALLEAVVAPISGGTPLRPGKRRNRQAAGLIALLGGLIFAVLYAVLAGGLIAARQGTDSTLASTVLFLSTPIYWLTIALFTGLFVLLAMLLSRASWLSFVVGSFFGAVLTYVAAVGAGLIAVHAWELTFEGAKSALWEGIAFSPLILVAPVLGREIPLWLGVWISRRARRLREEAPASGFESA